MKMHASNSVQTATGQDAAARPAGSAPAGQTTAAQYLVLGAMPAHATAASHKAAGPWCFAGQEEHFPQWEDQFDFAPEPLCHNLPLLETTARKAQALCVDSLPALARELCPHSAALPPVYWEVLLTPWAIMVSKQICERFLRVQAMVQAWGHIPLQVAVLPADCHFSFATEQDFTLHGALGTDFNHWLFSRLLETCWPSAWQKISLPALTAHYGADTATTQTPPKLTARLRQGIRQAQLRLLFPRLKGLSVWQALRFSLALAHISPAPDHSLALHEHFSAAALKVDTSLPVDVLPIFSMAMPRSLRRLKHPRSIRQALLRPVTRVASVLAYEDAAYRQRLALWRARGQRLAYVQHGANYGQVRVTCDTALVEYSQHAFFTWGWSSHSGSRGNFIPLPYPQLVRQKNSWQGKEGRHLLYVGAEMPAHAYRLDAHPTPLQMLDYRKDKERFFAALGLSLQNRAFYRPYFDVPGCLQDAPWLLSRFPQVRRSTGPLGPQMRQCRLLVVDHHGTTVLEAMAANIPLILFWRPQDWPVTPECEVLLSMLERAGIWFADPLAAAAKVQEVWDDPATWWRSTAVHDARRAFCALQALTVTDSENQQWLQTLKKL